MNVQLVEQCITKAITCRSASEVSLYPSYDCEIQTRLIKGNKKVCFWRRYWSFIRPFSFMRSRRVLSV